MSLKKQFIKPDFIITLLFAFLCICLIYIPTGFEEAAPKDSNYARGKVNETDNSDVRQNLLVRTGTQELTVTILNGPYKGQTTKVFNQLQGKMELDEVYAVGNTLLVEFAAKDGKVCVLPASLLEYKKIVMYIGGK